MKPVKSSVRIAARVFVLLLLTLLAPCLLVSCGKKKEAAAETVVVINGVEFTRAQVDEIIDIFRMQQLMRSPGSVFEGGDEMRRGAARRMASDFLMLEVIKERQWEADSAAIEAAMESFIKFGGGNREAFLAQLKEMGETVESVRKSIAEGILLDSLMKQVSVIDTISDDDDEARARYVKNKERYVSPGRVRASQIIVAFNPADDNPGQGEAMMQKVQEALEKAKSGRDFNEVAKEYSSMPDDIDMGWFSQNDLVPEFGRALFAVKKGEITDVVPSGMGFHILKKTDEEAPRQMEYDEASASIKRAITGEKREKAVNSYLDSLLGAANIRFIDQSLDFMNHP